MRIALRYVFTRQFSRVWTPGLSSRFFHGNESPAGDMRCYVAYIYNGNLFHS